MFFTYSQVTAIAGIVGNLALLPLILLIGCRRRTFGHPLPELLFIFTKVLFDTFYLVAYSAEFFHIRTWTYASCIAQDSFMIFARHVDSVMIILLIVERFLAIMCPEEYDKCFPREKSGLKIGSLICLLILPIAIWDSLLALFGNEPNNAMQVNLDLNDSPEFFQCVRKQNALRRISSFNSYMLTFFIPMMLFALTNALIWFKVHFSMGNIRFMRACRSSRLTSSSSTSSTSQTTAAGTSTASASNGSTSGNGQIAEAEKGKPRAAKFSSLPLLFSLAFVLLNSPVYFSLFVYPPTEQDTFADNGLIMGMKSTADLMNLLQFTLNLPLFTFAKIF